MKIDLLAQLTHRGPGFNYNKEHIGSIKIIPAYRATTGAHEVHILPSLARHDDRFILVAVLLGESLRVLKPPGGDLSLVKLVELPVGSAISLKFVSQSLICIYVTYLRIEEPQQDRCRNQHASPYIDGLDAHISCIRANHVRNGPLKGNTGTSLA